MDNDEQKVKYNSRNPRPRPKKQEAVKPKPEFNSQNPKPRERTSWPKKKNEPSCGLLFWIALFVPVLIKGCITLAQGH